MLSSVTDALELIGTIKLEGADHGLFEHNHSPVLVSLSNIAKYFNEGIR
jgi:hypothetical protein